MLLLRQGLFRRVVSTGRERVRKVDMNTNVIGLHRIQGRWFSSAITYVDEMISMYSTPQINMTDLMINRHLESNPALFYLEEDDVTRTYSYADCERYSSQLSALLANKGLEKGDRVAVMLPKSPQLVFAALGLWRMGYVFVPLFAAFERDAIKIRLEDSGAKVVITDIINRNKFNFIFETDYDIDLVTTIIDSKLDTEVEQKTRILASDTVYSLANFQQQEFSSVNVSAPVTISPQDTICLLYTSGTTGLPKGVAIPAFSLASFHAYMEHGLGLQSSITADHAGSPPSQLQSHQRYLSIADPAWAYGLYYNLIGPLLTGIPPTYLSGSFDPQRLLKALETLEVTHFAAAPSAYRALCAYDQKNNEVSVTAAEKDSMFLKIKENLQCASSAGEPLNPEIIDWWRSKMSGRSIADHYGQSETGMTVNWHWADGLKAATEGMDGVDSIPEWTLKGSMGRSMAGFRMVCLAHTEGVVEREVMNEPGELAVDLTASPLMWFRGYLNNPHRSSEAISACKKYYLTGDTVTHKKDELSDNIFWFSTRKDDVIMQSGLFN
jgi:acetyl-CoA synthetase